EALLRRVILLIARSRATACRSAFITLTGDEFDALPVDALFPDAATKQDFQTFLEDAGLKQQTLPWYPAGATPLKAGRRIADEMTLYLGDDITLGQEVTA